MCSRKEQELGACLETVHQASLLYFLRKIYTFFFIFQPEMESKGNHATARAGKTNSIPCWYYYALHGKQRERFQNQNTHLTFDSYVAQCLDEARLLVSNDSTCKKSVVGQT